MLVSAEQVSRVDLVLDIAELVGVKAVGEDDVALCLELIEVIDDKAVEEAIAVLERGLVDDDRDSFRLDALHDALDGGSAEVVRIGLHGEAVDADGVRFFGNDAVGDEVLADRVGLDDRFDHRLGHIAVIGEQLLGVFGEAVSAVAKRRIVVMAADTGIHAHTVDDLLRVESLGLRVSVELVEVADAHREVSVGEQLDRFRFGGVGDQCGDDLRFLAGTLFLSARAFEKELGEHPGLLVLVLVRTDDDAAGMQVVIESLGFAQELRAEDDVLTVEFFTYACGVAHRNRGLDDHDGVRVIFHDQLDHSFDCRCVKVLGVAIVVRRGRYHNKVRIRVCSLCIQSCGQVQFFFCEILLDIVILNRRLFTIDQLHFFRDDIHCINLMMLRQQCGY